MAETPELKNSEDTKPTTPEPEVPKLSFLDILNNIDPKKVQALTEAIVSPFQSGPRKERLIILVLTLIVLCLIIVAMFVLAALGRVDGGVAVFAIGTAFGYIFGFLSKLFVNG